jgi:hypothetical protein
MIFVGTSCSPLEEGAGTDLSECPAHHPLCTSFFNDGSHGGTLILKVDESAGTASVTTNGLANHEMGPYGLNPNAEASKNNTFTFPLTPSAGPTDAGFGTVAVAFNGVSLFNPADARDIGGCTGNAGFIEADHVDPFGGHPTPDGTYHYHSGEFLKKAEEIGLSHNPTEHASLVGYGFDGLPIYGPHGFSDPNDAESNLKMLKSCYRLKAERDCCDTLAQCATSATFENKILEMGAFVEDFEFDQAAFDAGQCDLDEFNSRQAVTPEYPEGTRIYVMTFDDNDAVAFPFIFGTRYWGSL